MRAADFRNPSVPDGLSALSNRPGQFCSISVVETSRVGTQHWRFICRSNDIHLDEHHVRYTDRERERFQQMTAWEIEQADPLPQKTGNWEQVWRFRFAMEGGSGVDVLPFLITTIRQRFPKHRKLEISVCD